MKYYNINIRGRIWNIIDSTTNVLTEGTNTNFSHITKMHSYQSEIIGVLSELILTHDYCFYFSFTFEPNLPYYGDNLELIKKLNNIKQQRNHYEALYKNTDNDIALLLKEYIPTNIDIIMLGVV